MNKHESFGGTNHRKTTSVAKVTYYEEQDFGRIELIDAFFVKMDDARLFEDADAATWGLAKLTVLEKENNWQPQHFPHGTLVKLGNFARNEDGTCSYTSKRNGGLIVEIDHLIPSVDGGYQARTLEPSSISDLLFTFHISHVDSIVKRGDGKVIIKHRGNGTFHDHRKTCIDYLLGAVGIKPSKSKYYSTNTSEILYKAASKFTRNELAVVREEMFRELKSQSFVKETIHQTWGNVIVADKKRTDRWVKQNFNRFLMSEKEIKKSQKEEYESWYEQDDDL